MPRVHSAAVFIHIAAHKLDFEQANAGTPSGLSPRLASQWPGIHTIGDNGEPNRRIIDGDGLRHLVADTLDGETRREHRLLDGIERKYTAASSAAASFATVDCPVPGRPLSEIGTRA